MALKKFLENMNIIRQLDDEPNDVGGLTADALKAAFDESGLSIQEYINGTLTDEIDETFATKEEMQGIVLGQVPDGTITEEKLADALVEEIGSKAPATLTGTTPPTTSTVGAGGQFYLLTEYPYMVYCCIDDTDGLFSWEPLSPYKIGDTIITSRVDLDDDWLLCNGDPISNVDYPALSELLSPSPAGTWTNNKQGGSTLMGVAFGNGYFVAVGASGSGTIRYTTNPAGVWSSKTVAYNLNGIAFGDGYFVAVGAGGAIYYATDPAGAWTNLTAGSQVFRAITFANGMFVAVGDTNTVYYTVAIPASWQQKTGLSGSFQTVHYAKGYWTIGTSGGAVLYAKILSDTFNTVQTGLQGVYSITYGNDYWVATYGGLTAYALHPAGAWIINATPSTSALLGIIYKDGYFVATGGAGNLCYSLHPAGAWTYKSISTDGFRAITFANGMFVAVGDGGAISYTNSLALPTISIPRSHVYIKAK